MMLPGYPKDEKVLAGIGKVSIRHGQMDYALQMCVKDLAGVSTEEALDATDRQTSRELRERVRKLARQKFGEGTTLVKLDAIINRSHRLSDKRNDLLHALWASELDGDDYVRSGNQEWERCPTAEDLVD